MKPENLKTPFTRADKRILIKDRILHFPEGCPADNFDFPGWNSTQIFNKTAPLKIEFCSGNGHWIAERAMREPTSNWIAVEMQFDRVKRIWSKRENHKIDNLFIVCGEALATTTTFCCDETVSEVFINFPDPWPKRRHAHFRLIQAAFIKQLERVLQKEGTITFVTDDIPYSEQFIDLMNNFSSFESVFANPYFLSEYENYGNSNFEDIWRKEGRGIRYHQYRKKS